MALPSSIAAGQDIVASHAVMFVKAMLVTHRSFGGIDNREWIGREIVKDVQKMYMKRKFAAARQCISGLRSKDLTPPFVPLNFLPMPLLMLAK